MSLKMFYLLLAVVGCLVPYVFGLQFLHENGFNWDTFSSAITANGLTTGYATDVLIASIAFWTATFELYRRDNGPAPWVFVILTLVSGLGLALPLYLFVRHVMRDNGNA